MKPTPPPDGLWTDLDPAYPVTLLPIRLETRFSSRLAEGASPGTAATRTLLVRIYPDDLTVAQTGAGYWPAEVAAGREYWDALGAAPAVAEAELTAAGALTGLTDAERAARLSVEADALGFRAWEVLVRHVGLERAVPVAEATRDGAAPVEEPRHGAPVARLLPDAWVITGQVDGRTVFTHYLPRVPGDLKTGPDPEAPGLSATDPRPLGDDEEIAWLVDFRRACEIGMAAEIDLPDQSPATRLSRLTVVGVVSESPDRGPVQLADELAGLLTRDAAAGRCGLVRQGTPTNQLDDRRSGYTSTPDVYTGHRLLTGRSAPDERGTAVVTGDGPDGRRLERALGLDTGVLSGVDGYANADGDAAGAMNTALFPILLGEAIAHLGQPNAAGKGNPVLAQGRLNTLRDFAAGHVAQHVRARGPLPVVRVGAQPYGVLPVLAPRRWEPLPSDPAELAGLVALLKKLRWFFEQAAARSLVTVAGSAAGTGDVSDRIAQILGRSPVAHPGGYRVRSITDGITAAFGQAKASGSGSGLAADLANRDDVTERVLEVARRFITSLNLLPILNQTLFAPLHVGREQQMIQHVATGVDEATDSRPGTAEYLRGLLAPAGKEGPASPDLLYVLATKALDVGMGLDLMRLAVELVDLPGLEPLSDAPAELVTTYDLIGDRSVYRPVAAAPGHPAAIGSSLALSAHLNVDLTHLTADPEIHHAAEKYGASSPADLIDKVARATDAVEVGTAKLAVNNGSSRRALTTLCTLAEAHGYTTDDWERLVGEALDITATRLDAWYTSLASARLTAQRATAATGTHLGAWGVLLDLAPEPVVPATAPNGWADHLAGGEPAGPASPMRAPRAGAGFVHAPSIPQAITSGVLRAGELAASDAADPLAKIDLTSRRTRLALDLFDALAQGQSLDALLGYRAERVLQERKAYALIADLRARFPRTPPSATTPDAAPSAVLDGLALHRATDAEIAALGGDPSSAAALRAARAELTEVVDSMSDLLLADGVYQLANGRIENAAGSFTALAQGAHAPRPQVADEPRSGLTITHRVILALDRPASPDDAGWRDDAPRARLAAETERWVRSILGAATGIPITRGTEQSTLDTLGLCALDVVCESVRGGERRRIAARAELPETTLAMAEAIYRTLSTARPVIPADVVLPDQPATAETAGVVAEVPGPAVGELTRIAGEIAAQVSALAAAAAAVSTATAPGPDGQQPPRVPVALIAPLRGWAIPGALPAAAEATGGTVTTEAALTCAIAAQQLVLDVLDEVQRAQPDAAALPPGVSPLDRAVDTANAARGLELLAHHPSALTVLTKIVRRLGGEAVVPAIAVDHGLAERRVPGVVPHEVSEWLARLGRVRGPLTAYDDLRLFQQAAGRAAGGLIPHHLPCEDGLAWLGGPLGPAENDGDGPVNELRRWRRPAEPTAHVVVAGDPGPGTLHGLVLDEVAEVLPEPTVTTGLAVHYNAPNARPPQSILLAVQPAAAGSWGSDLLTETVHEAMDLARLRSVDLTALETVGLDAYLPLTYLPVGNPDPSIDSLVPTTSGPLLRLDIPNAVRKANLLKGVR